MTTDSPLASLSTNFQNHPLSTTLYLLAAFTISATTIASFSIAAIVGHTVTWPFITRISTTDLTLSVFFIGVSLFLALLAWATPYVITHLLTAIPSPSPRNEGLPTLKVWGLWAVIPALALLAAIWFSSIWSGIFPRIAASIQSILPPSAQNNLSSFLFMTLPIAVTYTVMLKDELADSKSTIEVPQYKTQSAAQPTPSTTNTQSTQDRNTTPQPANTTTNTSSKTRPEPVTQDTNASDDTQQSGESLFSSYDYDWQLTSDTTFDDVGGMDDVKEQLRREILNPLQGDTERYREFGVSIPNLLLHGPPGTGKTYMAQSLAGELDYPFVKLSASDITSKWINESGDNINDLFREAEQIGTEHGYAIVFIDEIDALLADRGMDQQHSENKKVVDEFLNHLSECGERRTLFIGATNHFESLDSAAVRTGRIDKKIFVPLPDVDARVAIFRAQLKSRPGGAPDTDRLRKLAEVLDGKNAADIKGIVDRSARRAVERGADAIQYKDLVAEVQDETSS